MTPTPPPTGIRPAGAAVAAAIAALVWAATNAVVVRFGFVNWDDDRFVLNPLAVRSPSQVPFAELFTTPELGYPIPVTRAVFAAQYSAFGLEPAGWHLVSLALGTLLVGAVVWIAVRESGRVWAAWIALIVMLHPVGAEPTAWVAAQKDLLAALLGVAAVALLVGIRGARGRVAAAAAVVAAILSKPSAVALPLVLATTSDASGPASEPRERFRRVVWTLPLLGVSAWVVLATVANQGDLGALREVSGPLDDLSHAAGLAWSATTRLMWPADLSPVYAVAPAPPGSPVFFAGVAVLAALGSLAWFAAASSGTRLARVGAAWVVAAWLPVSGVAGGLLRWTSDSYVALLLPGLAWLAVAAAVATAQRWPRALLDRRARAALIALAIAATCGVGAARIAAMPKWSAAVARWEHAYRNDPHVFPVCRNLGHAWVWRPDGSLSESIEPYERAAAVWSTCPDGNERNLRRAREEIERRRGAPP